MPETRYYRSKIGRLSFAMRNELNERLRDGASPAEVIAWISESKEFKAIQKKEKFGDLNAQNITDWRNTGYRDWLDDQASADRIRRLAEQASVMAQASGFTPATVAARLAAAQLMEVANNPDDPKMLNSAAGAIASLRGVEVAEERNALAKQRVELAMASLDLDRKKFQRTTCELFVKWYSNEAARTIVEDKTLDADARTEALGQLLFADLWDTSKK